MMLLWLLSRVPSSFFVCLLDLSFAIVYLYTLSIFSSNISYACSSIYNFIKHYRLYLTILFLSSSSSSLLSSLVYYSSLNLSTSYDNSSFVKKSMFGPIPIQILISFYHYLSPLIVTLETNLYHNPQLQFFLILIQSSFLFLLSTMRSIEVLSKNKIALMHLLYPIALSPIHSFQKMHS